MNTELPLTAMASACSTVPSVWVALDSYTKMNGGCAQSPALTPEQARQFAAELIASAESAEAAAAELEAAREAAKPTLRSFQVHLTVVAPAGLSDADVAGIIDLTDWVAGAQLDGGIIVDEVQHIPEHVPCAENNQQALYMDNIELFEPRLIPRAYKKAAEDWTNYIHEQDGTLKLAQLLYELDTRLLTGFTPDELETIERLEFEENNRLILRNGGAQ